MDEQQGTVVTNAEGTTAPASTTETKPAEVQPQTEVKTEAKSEPERTVPYSRFKEVNDRLRETLARQSASTLKESEDAETSSPKQSTEKAEAIDVDDVQLEKLAPVLEKRGFVTEKKLQAEKEAEKRVTEARAMSAKFDGENGLPKFDIEEITDFMKKNKVYGSYESAYNLLHHDAIIAKAIAEATSKKAQTTTTTGDTAFSKAPVSESAVSREGIAKMSAEEFAKMGGAKALRNAVLSGQVK